MQQFADPPGGKLQLIEDSESRLVISIPPGGKKARGIGCFAVLWLAITIPLSILFFSVPAENWEGGDAPPTIFLLLFFGLFYAVGFGMLFVWIRMRFMEVLLAVEPGRLTIQRTLLGRKKLKRCDLTKDSQAELVVSYTSNDDPVYTVRINTADGDEKFATALSRDEKQWIADTVNRFLGHEISSDGLSDGGWPTICDDCGGELLIGEAKRVCAECGKVITEDDLAEAADRRSSLGGGSNWDDDGTGQITEVPDALAPFELSAQTKIAIEREEPECLEFNYRARFPLVLKILMGGFLLIFCSVWYGFVLSFLFDILTDPKMGGERWFFAAFLSLFLLAGLAPLGTLIGLFMARVRVVITPQNLTASIGVGPLRKKKAMACSLIRNVGTGPVGTTTSESFGKTTTGMLQGVIVRSTDFPLPLTISNDEQFNNEVAGLVRYQLSQLGYLKQND